MPGFANTTTGGTKVRRPTAGSGRFDRAYLERVPRPEFYDGTPAQA
jgi:hypothetical protein